MNLLKLVMNNPKIVGQIAKQFGLSENQAQSAMAPMLGNILNAVKGNMTNQSGLKDILGAVAGKDFTKYVENPAELEKSESVDAGNGVLAQLFGGKEKSREVAQAAAKESGVAYGIAKKILPLLAGIAMGGLGKEAKSSGLMGNIASMLSSGSSAPTQNMNQLTGFARLLDMDGDGKVIDDVLGLVKRFF